MIKQRLGILFILFTVFLLSYSQYSFGVSTSSSIKDKKDKKEKKDKVEKVKIKDKKINDEKIKSEIIYTEVLDNIKKDKIVDSENINFSESSKESEVKINIKNNLKSLEDLLLKTGEISKEIKISVSDDKEKFKDHLKSVNSIIVKFSDGYDIFQNELSKEEKALIIQQNELIMKSKNKINKLIINLEKVINKKDNKQIFDKNKEIEKEVRMLYRQYRAIEWLIFES